MTLVRLLCDMARRYPRYGYRMLHQMVVRQWIQQGRQEKLNVLLLRQRRGTETRVVGVEARLNLQIPLSPF